MNTFISMLRGINVSGQKKIQMAELRSLYESLGLVKVRTYVQSGNVVFDSVESDTAKLAGLVEAQIERVFGYALPVFVRDVADFQRIIISNPFLTARNEDPAKLHVTFLYRPLVESTLSTMLSPNADGDEFFGDDQEIFLFCPNGYGRTKLSNNFFERKLKVAATTRNWQTVLALHKIAKDQG
jgi:uncharacterized protein (DUF1697 family)